MSSGLFELMRDMAEREQLQELSRKKLGQYVGKASADLHKSTEQGERHAASYDRAVGGGGPGAYWKAAGYHSEKSADNRIRAARRLRGLQAAGRKLAEEDIQELHGKGRDLVAHYTRSRMSFEETELQELSPETMRRAHDGALRDRKRIDKLYKLGEFGERGSIKAGEAVSRAKGRRERLAGKVYKRIGGGNRKWNYQKGVFEQQIDDWNEEVERLDELSSDTLRRYMGKAVKQVRRSDAAIDKYRKRHGDDKLTSVLQHGSGKSRVEKHRDRINKRSYGYFDAEKRLYKRGETE